MPSLLGTDQRHIQGVPPSHLLVASDFLLKLFANDHRALAIALGLDVGKMDAIADGAILVDHVAELQRGDLARA